MESYELQTLYDEIIKDFIIDYPMLKNYCVRMLIYIKELHYRRILKYNSAATVNKVKHTLTLNKTYFDKYPEEIEECVRHEIAHILTWKDIGKHTHSNRTFINNLKLIGGSKFVNNHIIKKRKKHWSLHCPICKIDNLRVQKTKLELLHRYSCRNCGTRIIQKRYNEKI